MKYASINVPPNMPVHVIGPAMHVTRVPMNGQDVVTAAFPDEAIVCGLEIYGRKGEANVRVKG